MKKKITLTLALLLVGVYLINIASALVINSVSMDPASIAPGETSRVAISLKNNGDNDLTDVSVSLDFTNLPLAPYNSGSEYTISELDSDKTKETSFQIIAFNDAKSGIYKIPVNIEYNEDGTPEKKQSVISVMINSAPIIDVSYDDGLLLKGQNNKVTVRIINKGLADVKFLDVSVGNSQYYSLVSQKQVYIGDVDSNDFQTADFNVFFNEKSPTTINLPVNIKYKDITNKEYDADYQLQLKVYDTQQAQSLGLIPKNNTAYIVIVVIVLIVIFFIYRSIRKRRQKKNLE